MPVEQRLAAAELFWDDEQSTDQQLEAVAAIASHMKFRTKSVLGLALEKRAKYLATLPQPLGRHRRARPRELSPGEAAADDGGFPG